MLNRDLLFCTMNPLVALRTVSPRQFLSLSLKISSLGAAEELLAIRLCQGAKRDPGAASAA